MLCLVLVAADGVWTPKAAATSPEPIRYAYDEAGRLRSVIDPAAGSATYSYDATGNITSIARGSTSTVAIIEFSPNGGPTGTAVSIVGTGFSPVAAQNTVTFNGSAATLVSATSTEIVATVPAGATTGTIAVTNGSSGAPDSNTQQFTSRENDGPLYYYRARYLSASFGRFTSEDPLGFAAGDANLYGYVGNNPIGYRDPSGQIAPFVAACLGGAAIDAAFTGVSNWLGNRKTTLGEIGAAAVKGCGAGLLGFGVGKLLGLGADWLLGRLATSSLQVARAGGLALHGNALASGRLTTLYQLSDLEGNLLKWGITSEPNYLSRYSQGFLADKIMIPIAQGLRAEMAAMERVLTERVPGRLNLERWAGSQFGNDMGVLETILSGL